MDNMVNGICEIRDKAEWVRTLSFSRVRRDGNARHSGSFVLSRAMLAARLRDDGVGDGQRQRE